MCIFIYITVLRESVVVENVITFQEVDEKRSDIIPK
jgi:hypothetical protein